MVSTDITITLVDGEQKHAVVRRPIPGIDGALLFDTSQLEFFTTMMKRLEGTAVSQPRTVTATSSRAVGGSSTILALLNELFPAPGPQPQTYPVINRIRFQNTERTKAIASVTIGFSSGDVVLEKENGMWRAVDFTNRGVR